MRKPKKRASVLSSTNVNIKKSWIKSELRTKMHPWAYYGKLLGAHKHVNLDQNTGDNQRRRQLTKNGLEKLKGTVTFREAADGMIKKEDGQFVLGKSLKQREYKALAPPLIQKETLANARQLVRSVGSWSQTLNLPNA